MSPFFSRLAERLRAEGHDAHRINLGFGDWLFWRSGGARNFRGRLKNWPNYLEEFLKDKNVTDIILLGDCRPHHRVAIEKARALGVEVTVIELGYLRPNWLTIERYGMSSLSHFPNDPKKILAIANQVDEVDVPEADPDRYFARMAFWDVCYKLSTVFLFWLYPFYKFHSIYHPIHEYFFWIVRLFGEKRRNKQADHIVDDVVAHAQEKPYFVYALQLNTDYQIRSHSPFNDQEGALDLVFQSFKLNADENARIVVKQHPLDAGVVNWSRVVPRLARENGVEDKVVFVDGGNLDLLLVNSLGLIVVNSTVGTSALSLGVPFITLGAAIFDVEGLSFQGFIDDFWSNRKPPDPELSAAFLKTIKATVQIPGGFYSNLAMEQGIEAATAKLLGRGVNGSDAYELLPPRYKIKASVEVPWF
ncbi:MAG: capsular biosynthesis protein [Hyphomicrobiales bacterium]